MKETKKPISSVNKSDSLHLLELDFNLVFDAIFSENKELWEEFLEDCRKMEGREENYEMKTADEIFSMIAKYKDKKLVKYLGNSANLAKYFMFFRRLAYDELKAKKLV